MKTDPTIAQIVLAANARGETPKFAIKNQVSIGKAVVLPVGGDNGNDAFKGAVLSSDGSLVTIRIPTAFKDAERIQSGKQEVSYTIGGETFWIGETALVHDGDSLPIGSTRQRLVDVRVRMFIGACLVELLHQAGFHPGSHNIALGFAIPNNEIQENDSGKLGVNDQTRSSLEEHLKNTIYEVVRTDQSGVSEAWSIRVAAVIPQAQTAGTVLVTTKSPNGKTVTDLDGMTVIDIGGGDLQKTDVLTSPYQMASKRLSNGTIQIARALQDKYEKYGLNDVAAQNALINRKLMVSGRFRDIGNVVDEVVTSHGQSLITSFLPALRQSKRFVVITGGGASLLHDMIEDRLKMEQKEAGQDYELINSGVSSILNAIGALFGVIFLASRKS